MAYQVGDQITSGGVLYTFNGAAWTYIHHTFPYSVTTSVTVVGTPVADPVTVDEGYATAPPNLVDTYDWEILSRLAMGSIYANEVQVSY